MKYLFLLLLAGCTTKPTSRDLYVKEVHAVIWNRLRCSNVADMYRTDAQRTFAKRFCVRLYSKPKMRACDKAAIENGLEKLVAGPE